MKIDRINIFHCDTPFKFSFHSPHMARKRSDSVVVELHFDNGLCGTGESAPRPYVTGETCGTVFDTIRRVFSKELFQREIRTLANIEETLEALEAECLRRGMKSYTSALGAIDIALLDALGQDQGMPIHDYLGPIVQDRLPGSLSVPFLPDSVIKELCHGVMKLELDSLKVIMSDDEAYNIDRVKLLRSLFGDTVAIRIEANGKWSARQAISLLEQLQPFHISGVEEPLPRGDIEGLREIRNKTGIPVIVDESMCGLADARMLIEQEACDVINIKISKCGGLLRSKRIRDYALSRHVPCQLGTHVGETAILDEATRRFAMTTSDLFCFEGFSHLLFDEQRGNGEGRGEHRRCGPSAAGLGAVAEERQMKLLGSLTHDLD